MSGKPNGILRKRKDGLYNLVDTSRKNQFGKEYLVGVSVTKEEAVLKWKSYVKEQYGIIL